MDISGDTHCATVFLSNLLCVNYYCYLIVSARELAEFCYAAWLLFIVICTYNLLQDYVICIVHTCVILNVFYLSCKFLYDADN